MSLALDLHLSGSPPGCCAAFCESSLFVLDVLNVMSFDRPPCPGPGRVEGGSFQGAGLMGRFCSIVSCE